MTIGIAIYDLGVHDALELCVAADEFGFDTIWLAEHLFSVAHSSVHPLAQAERNGVQNAGLGLEDELVDPWVLFGAAAARTSRIKLATGIYILALRHPLLTARHAATLHELSHGRFMLGVGAGWIAEEYEAVSVPFAERGTRLDESLDILRLAWCGTSFEYGGHHFNVPTICVHPRPVGVPIIVGGNSGPALRRAARLGDGWFSSGFPTLYESILVRERIMSIRIEQGRSGPFTTYIRVADANQDVVEAHAAEGFDDLVVQLDDSHWPTDGSLDDRRCALRSLAERVGLT